MKEKFIKVGVFSRPGSGMKAYLSSLVYALQRNHSQRFFVDFYNPEARKYIQRQIESSTEDTFWAREEWTWDHDGDLFDVVQMDPKTIFRLRMPDIPRLYVCDLFLPGTDFVPWRSQTKRETEPYKEHIEKMTSFIVESDSFLFLIDPLFSSSNDRKRVVDEAGIDAMYGGIINAIVRNKEISSAEEMPPIAFVFTKCDLWQEKVEDFKNYSQRILQMTFSVQGELLRKFETFKCRAVAKTVNEGVEDGKSKTEIGRPAKQKELSGVVEPFLWIIENTG